MLDQITDLIREQARSAGNSQWEEWSKACNSGHATRSPNALVTYSQYNF